MKSRRIKLVLSLLTTLFSFLESAGAADVALDDPLPVGVVGRFGSLVYRTDGWSTASALSPDGKILAVAGEDVTLHDLETGHTIDRFDQPVDAYLLTFLDQGRTLASLDQNGTIRFWSPGKKVESRPAWKVFDANEDDGPIATLSPSGEQLLVAPEEGQVDVWDLNTQKRLHRFPVPAPNSRSNYRLSPDGKTVATISGDGFVVTIDLATGKQLAKSTTQPGDYTHMMQYSPDGKRIVVTGGYSSCRVYDAATLRETHDIRHHDKGQRLMAFSPDSRIFATTLGDDFITLRNLESGEIICRVSLTEDGHWFYMPRVFFSPDGRKLIGVEEEGPVIRTWDTTTGMALTDTAQPHSAVREIIASPDGKTCALMSGSTAHVWDTATFRRRFHLHLESGSNVAFSPSSAKIAYAHPDHSVRVVDSITGNELITLVGHKDEVTDVAFGDDDNEIVTAGRDMTLRVWNGATARERRIHVPKIPESFGNDVNDDRRFDAFSSNGRMLITRHHWKDGSQLQATATKTGEPINTLTLLPELGGLDLAPNGRTLVGRVHGDSLKVFDTETGEATLTLRPIDEERREQLSTTDSAGVAYSADSRFVALSTKDDVDIWDLSTGKKVRTIALPGYPRGFGFIGKNHLAIGEGDTTVLLWDVSELRRGK